MAFSDDVTLPLDLVPSSEDGPARDKHGEPMADLMRSIILRAIDDIRNGGEVRAEALRYLSAEEDDYIFSFSSICEHFGIDTHLLRNAILSDAATISTRRRAA